MKNANNGLKLYDAICKSTEKNSLGDADIEKIVRAIKEGLLTASIVE